MDKQTIIQIPEQSKNISRGDRFFCLGSCFSSEIGKYARSRGIKAVVNPLGTMYNVHSLYKALKLLFFPENYEKKDLFHENNLFFSPHHSFSFSDSSLETCLARINRNLSEAAKSIRNSSVFIITPGTSVVYSYNDTIVANCHRLPHRLFTKKILSPAETTDYLDKIISLIQTEVPHAKIIITLSPVRHTPSDLVENSYSKAVLRCALHNEAEKGRAAYFPSYEIVNDQMRNYSYFKKDLVHLKKKSINYIMERFEKAFFDPQLLDFCNRYDAVNKMVNHRPKKPGSAEYFRFIESVADKIKKLEAEGVCEAAGIKLKAAYRLCELYYSKPETTGLLDSLFKDSPPLGELFSGICGLFRGEREKISLPVISDTGLAKKVKKIARKLVSRKTLTDYFS